MSNSYVFFSRQASRNSSRKQKHFLFEVGGNIGKSMMTGGGRESFPLEIVKCMAVEINVQKMKEIYKKAFLDMLVIIFPNHNVRSV